VTGFPPYRIAAAGAGYVPEGRRVFANLTVEENLKVPVERPGPWTIARIYEAFPRLAERKSNKGSQLSGGEQEMLSISRALLLNPKLLMLDEPSQGLAPLIVHRIFEVIRQLNKEGMAILLVEQNARMALQLANRGYVLETGTVTLAAAAHRFSVGMPFVYPDNSLDFPANFLSMMWKVAEPRFDANPALARALDILFMLHADHEQNCSTTAMRVVGSSHADPYSCCAAACAALYGPRHGGANEMVIRMLTEIGSIENVPAFIESVKQGEGGRLQGFGHRVYKNYDPRATIIKQTADEVFAITGRNPLLDIALKLEEIALSDEYFTSRRLYPNVDFYSGLIYQAMGFPLEMFPVLFAIPRTAGWLAHWQEMLDQDSKIARPRQLYIGAEPRQYVPLSQR